MIPKGVDPGFVPVETAGSPARHLAKSAVIKSGRTPGQDGATGRRQGTSAYSGHFRLRSPE